MNIRPMTLADCDGIARVLVDSWRDAYRGIVPDDFLAKISVEERSRLRREAFLKNDPPHSCLAAEDGGRIVGVSIFGRRRAGTEPFDAEIYALYCLPSAQRRGLGTRLFRESARKLKEEGHRSMMIWALSANAPARAFYEKMGGRPHSERTVEIGAPLPEVSYGWDALPAVV